jgi:hypothetical protein
LSSGIVVGIFFTTPVTVHSVPGKVQTFILDKLDDSYFIDVLSILIFYGYSALILVTQHLVEHECGHLLWLHLGLAFSLALKNS